MVGQGGGLTRWRGAENAVEVTSPEPLTQARVLLVCRGGDHVEVTSQQSRTSTSCMRLVQVSQEGDLLVNFMSAIHA